MKSASQKLYSQSKHGDRPLSARVYSNVLVCMKQIYTLLRKQGLILQFQWEDMLGCSCLGSDFHGTWC